MTGSLDLAPHARAPGLDRRDRPHPEREYAFHHSLTQDATYGTILLRRRRELHQRVGEVFEELYANRIEEFAPVLAYHFREGGDDERTLATRRSRRTPRPVYANAEAVDPRDDRDRSIQSARPDRRGPRATCIRCVAARSSSPGGSMRPSATTRRWRRWRGRAARGSPPRRRDGAHHPVRDAHAGVRRRSGPGALRTDDLTRARTGRSFGRIKALWNVMVLNTYSGGDPVEAVDAGELSLSIARAGRQRSRSRSR